MKKISKMITVSVVIVSFVFIGSSADAWWIFGPKKKEAPVMTTPMPEPQGKPFQPTFTRPPEPMGRPSSQPTFTRPPETPMTVCGQPLKIETIPIARFKAARAGLSASEQLNDDLLGNELSMRLKVVGGKPPYSWSVRSSVESVYPDAYCEDTSRCLPHMWTITPSGIDEATINGRFDNSLRYCMSHPEMLDMGEIRDPITGYIMNPRVCGADLLYFGEGITVAVTDSCAIRRTVEEKFAFKLNSPPETVSNLLAAEIHMKADDCHGYERLPAAGGHDCYDCVEIRFYDSSNNLLAVSAPVEPAEGSWRTYRLRVSPWAGRGGVNIEDIDRVALWMRGSGAVPLFDVTINSVIIYSKFRFMSFGPGATGVGSNIFWEVPYWEGVDIFPAKEENFHRPPAIWQKFNQPYVGPIENQILRP